MGNLGHLPWPLWELYGFYLYGPAALEGTPSACLGLQPSEASDGESLTHDHYFICYHHYHYYQYMSWGHSWVQSLCVMRQA